jgi:hypothetical protein
MKRLLSLAALLLCAAWGWAGPLWFAARVRVDHPASGVTNYGSATPVACEGKKSLLVTNAHVVRDTDGDAPITVTVEGAEFKARYVAGSKVTGELGGVIAVDGPDLALLEVDAELGWAQFGAAGFAEGERVWRWGYGGTADGKPVLRGGKVFPSPLPNSLADDGDSIPGDSGAGVFNRDGKLVGVCWGRDGKGAGFAVPLKTVHSFLADKTPERFPEFRKRLAGMKDALADHPTVK